MKRHLALVYVAGLFLLGVLVGALAMQLYHSVNAPDPRRLPGRGPAHRPDFADLLERRLDLTPDQVQRIDVILAESRAEAEAFHEEMLPRVREQMERTRERISEVLTPEQRERFEELHRRHRGRAERFFLGRRPGRRGEMGPPPTPDSP